MRTIFRTTRISVVDLSPLHPAHEAVEFMWRGAKIHMGRLPLWREDKAVEIAEKINAEASNEEEALAIFEEMSQG